MKKSCRVKLTESDLCNILRWYSVYAETLLARTMASDSPAVERALSTHSQELVSRLIATFDDQSKILACEAAEAAGDGEECGSANVPEEITDA